MEERITTVRTRASGLYDPDMPRASAAGIYEEVRPVPVTAQAPQEPHKDVDD